VYEIENFLLEPDLLRATLTALLRQDPLGADDETQTRLRAVATGLIDRLALIEVQGLLNEEFRRAVDVGGSPENAIHDLTSSSESSKSRIARLDASDARVSELLESARVRLRLAVESDSFLSDFPGERLLFAFAGEFGLDGEIFRNACLDQAQHMKLWPAGLEQVLQETLGS
jgi:hypothetical protein